MSTLYLIRHGQASYGVADYDQLSELGVRQARAIGAALPVHLDALYAGPLKRQRDTATALRDSAGRALPAIEILDELEEYPAWELLRHWVPRLAADDPTFAPLLAGAGASSVKLLDHAFDNILGRWGRGELDTPGVETIADFTARVRRAIDRIVAAHGRGAVVAAVTSGGVIGTALRLALDLAPARALGQMKLVKNASISEFVWRSDGFAWRAGDFSMVGFNHVHHLDAAAEPITYR